MKNGRKIVLLLFLVACSVPPKNNQQEQTTISSQKDYNAKGKQVVVYTTAKNTSDRLSITDTLHFEHMGQPLQSQVCVFVDPTHKFQIFKGIGGAVTDASAEVFAKLPKEKQEKILNAYFDDKKGIGYSLARTNINSCDFSSESYTYVKENDTTLKTFDIRHDKQYRIPLLKAIQKKVRNDFILYVSPWSPPAWMKDNRDMLHGGHLKPEFYQTWAEYFVKFIKSYEKEGVNIWGVTVQNEPMAKQTWESCIFTADKERDFIKNALGPTFNNEGLKDKKIIAWDHNRDLMYQRSSTILNDSVAAKYVWGIGFHWYVQDKFENVKRVHEAFPKTHLLFTEGCNFPFNIDSINEWHWGEKYGTAMINDFNNGAVGWTDWNILLNQKGGPNHVGNYCFAPIIANTSTRDLYFMNSYYYIGHFSKFIIPGASRIISSSNRDNLLTTAFLNPEGQIVVVILNKSEMKYPFYVWIKGEAAKTVSPAHSIQTLIIEQS